MRNDNLPPIVEPVLTNQQLRTMPKRNKLSIRSPYLVEGAAEGTLANVLLFALVLAAVTLIGLGL